MIPDSASELSIHYKMEMKTIAVVVKIPEGVKFSVCFDSVTIVQNTPRYVILYNLIGMTTYLQSLSLSSANNKQLLLASLKISRVFSVGITFMASIK